MTTNTPPIRVGLDSINRDKMRSLKDKFAGERIFIIGNGPSLNKHDLKKLDQEYSFGVNSIFLKEKSGFKPTFYSVEDSHVVDDNLEQIINYQTNIKFFLSLYKDKLPADKNVIFVDGDLGFYRRTHPFGGVPRFSRDASEVVFTGQSVTIMNLQIAFYMGFSEFYLIGMDFNYIKPDSVIETGLTWQSTEDDPNHFDPSYFGPGKKWHDPQLDKVELNYRHAKSAIEMSGRRIYNASIGGKLEVFQRVDWESLW